MHCFEGLHVTQPHGVGWVGEPPVSKKPCSHKCLTRGRSLNIHQKKVMIQASVASTPPNGTMVPVLKQAHLLPKPTRRNLSVAKNNRTVSELPQTQELLLT